VPDFPIYRPGKFPEHFLNIFSGKIVSADKILWKKFCGSPGNNFLLRARGFAKYF
jgi:hypothetical protein